MHRRLRMEITGIVQGVGFRPYIYNLAGQHHLTGWVLNDARGVILEVEGNQEALAAFARDLVPLAPPLARIEKVVKTELPPAGYRTFEIKGSLDQGAKFTLISPDLATCPDCQKELFDSRDRRYRYPFINCTNCGPRLTIIKDVPYDRANTTMASFAMCQACQREYDDPRDRRFHAQPNACPDCGPALRLLDGQGREIKTPSPLEEARKLISQGKILAIKGLGGYHLACDAGDEGAVGALRARKVREDKPFAVMMKDLAQVEEYCCLGTQEKNLLAGSRRPIVLVKKGDRARDLAGGIAPGNDYLGVMLPYTPLHHLLLAGYPRPMVMTSGNLSSEPIAFRDDDALARLQGIVDYFLIHNREIFRRCDDSVTRVFRGREYILRRSRGYAPEPVKLPIELAGVLACGAEQKNTFCLTRGKYGFLSHHIGDLENLETLEAFEEGVESFQRLFSWEPEIIAYDLHPEYLSTKYALSRFANLPKVGIQHHHAHIASCMAENGLQEEVIGVAFDGTGYGTDGCLWGGEFLVCDYRDFRRAAHLAYLPLPGGVKAIHEPWRMACAYLREAYGPEFLKLPLEFTGRVPRGTWQVLEEAVAKGFNSPLTSGMGRLFDAVAAILGIRDRVNYEGQGAIELEQLAAGWSRSSHTGDNLSYPWETRDKEGRLAISVLPVIRGIVADLQDGVPKAKIAWKFHWTIARLTAEIVRDLSRERGLGKVCLSGGVFQNMLLLGMTVDLLQEQGLTPYLHSQVPANDGGIALGQAIIANERRKHQCV